MGNEHNLFGATLEDHTRMRRVLSHGFSAQAISDQQPLISVHVNLFIRRLHEHCGNGARPVDMVTWYERVTFDIISDLSWGEPLGCLQKQADHPWIAALGHTVKYQMFLGLAERFRPLTPFLKVLIPKELTHGEQENFALATANVEKRIALGDSRPDFLESMIRQQGEKVSLPSEHFRVPSMSTVRRMLIKLSWKTIGKHEMISNSFLLMLGGSETSATALSAVTYFLTSHPPVLDKLTQEVLSAFKSEDEINVHSVQKLSYLGAVLDETLRLNPPLPHTSPRVVHQGGDGFCGSFVPEGVGPHNPRALEIETLQTVTNSVSLEQTVISIPQWAMFHSPCNFAEPESFIPERWLGDPRFDDDQREGRKPFGYGPRNCIGMK